VKTYTGFNQEALEASYAHIDERLQLIGVSRNHTSIKAHVHPQLALASRQLLLEAHNGRRRWDSIQGHVNDGCHSATGSSPGSCPEAFPFRTTWLIEMHVGVDQAGEQQLGRVVHVRRVCGETGLWDKLWRHRDNFTRS
jgi:hypothetical protein